MNWRRLLERSIGSASLIGVLALLSGVATAQVADFQIVWVNVGEVAAMTDGKPARAGRQLFMAPDLVEFSLKKITVARVDVDPAVIALKLGERFCLTSLQVRANSDDKLGVDNAPLTVSVRQDQREHLALVRGKNNICVAPTSAGEYPIRFNSLLPARDGTTRGAQVFLRVQDGDDPQPPDRSPSAAIAGAKERPPETVDATAHRVITKSLR